MLEVTQRLIISSDRLSHCKYEIIGWSEELCVLATITGGRPSCKALGRSSSQIVFFFFSCLGTNETGFFVSATSIRLGHIPVLHKYA